MRSRSSEKPSGSTFGEMWQKCLHARSGEPTGAELGVSALCLSPRLGSPPTSPAVCGHTARERNPDLALWKSQPPSITGSPHTIIPSLRTQPSTMLMFPQKHPGIRTLHFLGPSHTLEIATEKWGGREKDAESRRARRALTNPQRSEGLGTEDMQTKGF